MRRRASRAAIFAAVVAAHFLALQFFPDFRPPPEVSDQEPSLPITFFPVQSQKPESATPRERQPASRRRHATASSGRTRSIPSGRKRESATRTPSNSARPLQPWVDWDQEADAAVADRMERAAEAARRAGALSRWREHVMPAPWVRHGPEFRWDEARTSQRFVPTPGGLLVHINDRCLIIISPLALLGGCAIGHIPVYGDLFAHMDDPKQPADANVP